MVNVGPAQLMQAHYLFQIQTAAARTPHSRLGLSLVETKLKRVVHAGLFLRSYFVVTIYHCWIYQGMKNNGASITA